MTAKRAVVVWAAATTVAGLTTLALALILGGGAPQEPPPGISDAGRLPAWLSHLVDLISLGAGVITVGLGLVGSGLLDPDRNGSPRNMGPAAGAAVLWAAITVHQIGIEAWVLDGRSPLLDSDQVRALLYQLGLAVLSALFAGVIRRPPAGALAVLAALAALIPTALVGHARTADHQVIAGVAISAHIASAALWVGGLAALGWLGARGAGEWTRAVPRYSALALVAVVVIAASGTVAALDALDTPSELLTSKYGAIITLKLVALAGLAGAGQLQRSLVVARSAGRRRGFLVLAGFELTVMAVVFGLAGALGSTPPPT